MRGKQNAASYTVSGRIPAPLAEDISSFRAKIGVFLIGRYETALRDFWVAILDRDDIFWTYRY